ncbi:MAG: type II secretion system F family protein [Clostridiales Family XIII bacterium]|jgi:type IV pilus assembly protein PilC|nr:type II secretion system F family protein [Clostridiales Family XIII bacterium]
MSTNKQTLSAEELSAFSAQMALTVKTGIPLAEAVMILRDDAGASAAKNLFDGILEGLDAGEPLAEALRRTKAFPGYMTQMIEIGEASGRLDQVLDSLAGYYAREDNIGKSVRSAVTYPAIMLAILVAIILILIIKVLPIFNEVFISLGGDLSPLARGAMDVGAAISAYSVGVIIAVAAVAAALIIMRATKAGRAIQRRAAQKIFKKLSLDMATGKFASGIALMLASGIDVGRAVELTLPLVDNPVMNERVTALKDLIEQGKSFSESAVETRVFTGLEARLLTLGFKSGDIDAVMERIAQDYENKTDERLDNLISVIEPTMVAVLCVIVGLILLSAMLPLLAVMTSIV